MDRAEFIELHKKFSAGDKNSFNILIEQNLALVSAISKKFIKRGHDYEDLFQIGSIGLVKAVKKFDVNFGTAFSTYAVPMITGEIKRYLRDDNVVHTPRDIKIKCNALRYNIQKLESKIGTSPTDSDLIEEYGYTHEELRDLYTAGGFIMSLDTNTTNDKGEASETFLNKLPSPDTTEDIVLSNEKQRELYRFIDTLGGMRPTVMKLRLEDKTQVQIAEILGVSQVQVSRLITSSIEQLKFLMGDDFMTRREECFELFKQGMSDIEIAKKLGWTSRTVAAYKGIYSKLTSNKSARKGSKKEKAFKLFKKGATISDVVSKIGITHHTAEAYSCEFKVLHPDIKIERSKPANITADKNSANTQKRRYVEKTTKDSVVNNENKSVHSTSVASNTSVASSTSIADIAFSNENTVKETSNDNVLSEVALTTTAETTKDIVNEKKAPVSNLEGGLAVEEIKLAEKQSEQEKGLFVTESQLRELIQRAVKEGVDAVLCKIEDATAVKEEKNATETSVESTAETGLATAAEKFVRVANIELNGCERLAAKMIADNVFSNIDILSKYNIKIIVDRIL